MSLFNKILEHRGHILDAVSYNDAEGEVNAAIECRTCEEVIVDEDWTPPDE